MLVRIGLVIASYLVGSTPVGLLVGKFFFGADIRTKGSGNLGATNAYRVLGPIAGLAVFALDVAKGAVPVLVALGVSGPPTDVSHSVALVAVGMAAIAGHNWSIYLGFSGGKGVATAAGVLVVLFPAVTGILTVVWIVAVLTTGYVSVASIAISGLFPLLVIVFCRQNPVYVAFSVVAAAVVLFRHRSNIGRLLQGTEPKVLTGRPKETPDE